MRCMNRNKIRFFYALYEGRKPITDEWGNTTGEYEIKYGNPTEFHANISPAMGETLTRQFGDSVSYDKIIVMDNGSVVERGTHKQLYAAGGLYTKLVSSE